MPAFVCFPSHRLKFCRLSSCQSHLKAFVTMTSLALNACQHNTREPAGRRLYCPEHPWCGGGGGGGGSGGIGFRFCSYFRCLRPFRLTERWCRPWWLVQILRAHRSAVNSLERLWVVRRRASGLDVVPASTLVAGQQSAAPERHGEYGERALC